MDKTSAYSAKFQDQRVSLATKQTPTWYIPMAKYIINLARQCNDKTRIKTLLDMANGVVEKSMYEYVLRTYGDKNCDDSGKDRILKDVRDIDLLQPIKDTYMGEFVTSYNNYQVTSEDPNTVFIRNKEFGQKVNVILQQKIINELNKSLDTGSESQSMPDINDLYEKFITEWNDERVKKAQNRLNLLNKDIEAYRKYNDAYYYAWATEEVYSYRQVLNESVDFRIISPMDYYRIPSGNYYVEDDDYGVEMFNSSLYSLLDEYKDDLLASDKEFLKNIVVFKPSGNVNYQYANLLKSRIIDYENGEPFTGIDYNSLNFSNSPYANPDNIRCAKYVFKTEVKVGYVTYVDVNGELSERIVNEDYELDIQAGDLDIVYDWINQVYVGTIIGYNMNDSSECVYTKPKPISVQRERFDNVNKCKLPYNGYSYIHVDSAKKPIPYRVNPYLAIHRVLMYELEKAIYNWKSFIMLGESLLSNSDELSQADRLKQLQRDSLFLFNDVDLNPVALQGMKEVATTATYNYINAIIPMLDRNKAECWEVANMNPTRIGATNPYQGKSVTENNIAQSLKTSSWTLEIFNLFRCRDYGANYDYSKIAWSDGYSGNYIDSSTNQPVYVEVDAFEHFHTNIGIFFENSRLNDEKLKAAKQIAFSASQNGDYEVALEAINTDNTQLVGKAIRELMEKKRVYEKNIEDAKNEAIKYAEDKRAETAALDRESLEKVSDIEAKGRVDVALINMEKELRTWEIRMTKDLDANGYISKEESEATSNDTETTKATLSTISSAIDRAKLAREKQNLAAKTKTVQSTK